MRVHEQDAAHAIRSVAFGRVSEREQERRIAEMFDRVAPRYDVLNRVLSFGTDIGWRRAAAARARLGSGEVALDVGVGTGDLAFALLALSDPTARVLGLDLSPAMLERSVRRAARRGLAGRYTALLGSAGAVPLPDASMDRVVSGFTLRNIADLPRGLREFRRVLRPGGRAVLLELSHPPGRRFARLYSVYFENVAPAMAGLLGGDRAAYHYLPRSLAPFPGAERLAELLREAGFRDVTFELRTFGIAAVHHGRA
jgi:demethylmenaquinone methyltransferase/2-methoxy-6-polyprenyl-1,4-benzoquinol methylase